MKPLILIGGGGHCKSVIDAAESIDRKVGGIIERPLLHEATCLVYPVVGSDDDIPKFVEEYEFIVTVGFIKDPALRIKLHKLVKSAGGRFATVIASNAYVSRHSKIGIGTVILQGASVNAGVKIGCGCIINSHANIEHDVEIGDHCHISTGAMINGGCKIGNETFIGSGSVIGNGVKIHDKCIIGAGSVVMKNIEIPGTYCGIPARRI